MTLKSKLFLIGILIPLSLPFIWRSAFAFDSYPATTEISVIPTGNLYNSSVTNARMNNVYTLLGDGTYSNVYIITQEWYMYLWMTKGNIIVHDGSFYSDVPNDNFYQTSWGAFNVGTNWASYGVNSTDYYILNGVVYYKCYMALARVGFNSTSSSFYSSSVFSDDSLTRQPNLDISAYLPDLRTLYCELSYLDSDTYGELPYIYVSTSDTVDYLNSYCYFEYTDARGPGQTVTVLSDQYINPHIVDEDYSAWIFSPSLISAYDCTLTSLTYYSADYGQKTIELNIDIIYGEAYPEVQDWNYFYYFTTYMESQDNDNIVYSYSTLYLSYPYNSTYYYYDFEHSVLQPFTIKVLLMPDYMVGSIWGDLMNLGSSDMSLFYQIYEQFDLILTNVNQSTFDAFYGQQGIYDSIYTDWNRDQKEGLRDLFALVPTYINANENVFSNLSASMYQTDVGFIYTRSFLMKRIITNLGDIDDRLLEFETRLVDEDGVLYGIQSKLNNLYKQDNEFYNDMARFVRRWDYWLDENVLGVISSKLDSILTRLNDILNSIGNVDVPVDLEDLGAYRPLKAIYDFVYSLYGWTSDHIGFMLASFNGLRTGYIGEVSGTPIPLMPYPSDVPALPTINVTPIPVPVIPTYVPIESGG